MAELIQFVRNYDDRSTDRGFQFEFHCDKCQNGYLSAYEPSTLGVATGLLRAAGDLFGGIFGSAGNSAYEIQRAIGGKAHDDALRRAVEAGKQHFKQCTRCGHWVCPEVCWNSHAGLCDDCAPNEQKELSALKAQATAQAIRDRAYDERSRYVTDLDFEKGGMIECQHCGTRMSANVKFCADCGTATAAAQAKAKFCTECGSSLEAGAKFCSKCGNKH